MKKLNKKTESEDVFWQLVRNRKLFGKKFLRQYAIKYTDYDSVTICFGDRTGDDLTVETHPLVFVRSRILR